MSGARTTACDVAVIGSGMAGMASALFASSRGLSVVQVGSGGGLLFASGLLDLLGVHPAAEATVVDAPFDALRALAASDPDHPLARIDPAAVRAALDAFVGALSDAGLPYAPRGDRNRRILTSIGTAKPTYAVPRTMVAGADALEARTPCVLVDFRGLREFSARQIVSTVGAAWPGLRSERVEFPGAEAVAELYAAHLARALEATPVRDRAIATIRPRIGDARAVGVPAILGLARSSDVHAAFEAGLGVPVFEIPTMPTSVPGLRLSGALEAAVAVRGVRRRTQASVRAIAFDRTAGTATLDLDGMPGGERIVARTVVMATGRFSGHGLSADRRHVRETILDLPVAQPASREDWHRRDFLDPAGHAINRAGLRTDDAFRPLDASGTPAWDRLFAAGSILAGQDWMRQKCGSGLAVATAWAAVDRLSRTAGLPGAA